ncbi:hypothetical protein NSR00_17775 [Aeribacillus sp. FSL K6-8394]|uniref:hypothetical protein n=1 Tax=Aeribacillus sp. FSL K6-8394 TaxID=2954570 RepID=UPI0030F6F980
MPKYRKKPVVIEAIQFKDDTETIEKICGMKGVREVRVDYSQSPPILKIPTLEGVMTANVGDYIIRGVKDELYPCKPDIFEKTYEKVEE